MLPRALPQSPEKGETNLFIIILLQPSIHWFFNGTNKISLHGLVNVVQFRVKRFTFHMKVQALFYLHMQEPERPLLTWLEPVMAHKDKMKICLFGTVSLHAIRQSDL